MLRLGCGFLSAGLLLLPLGLIPLSIGFQPAYYERVEKRNPTAFPSLSSPSALGDRQAVRDAYYAIKDRFPFKGTLVEAIRILDIYVFGQHRFRTADLGKAHWTYYRESYWQPSINYTSNVQATLATLEQFLANHRAARRRNGLAEVRLVIAPDKHTIYPEYLSAQGAADRAVTRSARAIVHTWFAQNRADPRIIDMWSILQRHKSEGEYLFIPNDTHHSPRGAMVMAKAIVDSIDPSAWYREDIVAGEITPYTDIAFNMGLFQHQLHEQTQFTFYSGVAARSPQAVIDAGGRTFASEAAAIEALCTSQSLPESCLQTYLTRYRHSPTGAKLIAGKTLVIHDSFMDVFTKDILRPLFSDISFLHHNQATADALSTYLGEYDYVIIQSVERLAFGMPQASDNSINKLLGASVSTASE